MLFFSFHFLYSKAEKIIVKIVSHDDTVLLGFFFFSSFQSTGDDGAVERHTLTSRRLCFCRSAIMTTQHKHTHTHITILYSFVFFLVCSSPEYCWLKHITELRQFVDTFTECILLFRIKKKNCVYMIFVQRMKLFLNAVCHRRMCTMYAYSIVCECVGWWNEC